MMGEGSFPEGFDTSNYCQCATTRISNSMTVEDAADASVDMLMNIDDPSALQGNAKLYFDIVQECVQKFR